MSRKNDRHEDVIVEVNGVSQVMNLVLRHFIENKGVIGFDRCTAAERPQALVDVLVTQIDRPRGLKPRLFRQDMEMTVRTLIGAKVVQLPECGIKARISGREYKNFVRSQRMTRMRRERESANTVFRHKPQRSSYGVPSLA